MLEIKPELSAAYPLNIARARSIEGWMSDVELLYLAFQAYQAKDILEIGSWCGRSTRALVDNTQGHVVAVDTWAASGDEWQKEFWSASMILESDWQFKYFTENMSDVQDKLEVYRGLSTHAAMNYAALQRQFDFIFIDASHDYKNVVLDINAWKPLVRPGGVLAGHDYDPKRWPDVVRAVNELLPEASNVVDHIWAIRIKGDENGNGSDSNTISDGL